MSRPTRLTKAELVDLVRDMRAAMLAGSACKCRVEHEPGCAKARYLYMLEVSGGVLLG